MSAVATTVKPEGVAERVPGLWKTPSVLGVFTVLVALLVLISPRSGDSTFRWSRQGDWFSIPDVSLPANAVVWAAVLVCLLCTAYAAWNAYAGRKSPLLLVAVFAVVAVAGFLAWAVAGKTLPVVGLLAGSLALAVPLVFGALGGVLGERAGVVNIAIDGQLLFGAFGAAIAASLTGSPWAGLVAAMVAGMLVALLLGLFAITYWVEQVIVGVVLNVLVIGFTSFMFSQVLSENAAALNNPPHFPRWEIPLLSGIPVVGPIFFRQTVLVYLMYVAVFLIAWALYRSKWGLRVRAVGEHPKAADTVGINVIATRYRTVLLAGAIAGIGGATYTLVSVPSFGREMTGGAGYIALAAVIFGKWDPIKATLAALLFGFASNVESVLSVIGSPVPSQFMLMLPYVVTIFAVAGLVGHSRAPAADGKPYRKS
ncbi:simple sugar transport system permease protein [Nocardioides luteus]|uniref:ABC transporter permease n=1 Tax=Nocardioides luteus TaxID=1844 RepID=A0ABQ5SVF3_9ACTN|nr:ABC transporter permease [Nocardioides luteus]MDR7309063.1 simple sugar transport system permease protein [Nocardioides luteus]GGR50003.1 ABC transporter permease [Nocardioides luteus]GLJ67469.1 ABC transporter permease [Nocardioides luteus]